ncbi:hypothetical protein RJ641_034644 [Dillenia turbinata]|uniref:Uncharacterized protein n=1 Tax=Dillenia turbinata TaxID=194707 RepID=A0AAN8VML6_9MAGN
MANLPQSPSEIRVLRRRLPAQVRRTRIGKSFRRSNWSSNSATLILEKTLFLKSPRNHIQLSSYRALYVKPSHPNPILWMQPLESSYSEQTFGLLEFTLTNGNVRIYP